jgi:hypothetical protein
MMPETCTCGTELAPGALFCHKCGKPQREIAAAEPETRPEPEFAPVTPPPPPPQALPLNFHNPIAVRIALLVAACATVLSFVPFLNWAAAGFFAVFFYRRKTGSLLNVGAGARMGWITGLLMFGLWVVAIQVPAAISGTLGASLRAQMKAMPAQDATMQQMLSFFQSGPGLAFMVVFSVIASFFFIIGLSMAGGALGAKFAGRQSS